MTDNANRKILFSDLDDTLLTSKKEISEANLRAIGEMLAQGHLLALCTGRPFSAAKVILDQFHLESPGCYALCYNGGLLYDPWKKEILYKNTIPLKTVRNLFRQTKEAGIFCLTFCLEGLIFPKACPEQAFYLSRSAGKYFFQPDLPDSLTEEPCKCLMVSLEGKEKLLNFAAGFRQDPDFPLSLFMSNDYYMEIVPQGINKGEAIRRLCRATGIPVENTVAAGDAENDLDMIRTAGVGCAVANATDSVKAISDYIARRSCDEDGVEEIIRKFIL